MFNAAQQESRKAFEQNKAVAGEAAEALVKHAKEVAIILRTNVIQGKKEGDEVYSEYSRGARGTATPPLLPLLSLSLLGIDYSSRGRDVRGWIAMGRWRWTGGGELWSRRRNEATSSDRIRLTNIQS